MRTSIMAEASSNSFNSIAIYNIIPNYNHNQLWIMNFTINYQLSIMNFTINYEFYNELSIINYEFYNELSIIILIILIL